MMRLITALLVLTMGTAEASRTPQTPFETGVSALHALEATVACIGNAVTADPRYEKVSIVVIITDVSTSPTCLRRQHEMIDAYDRYFGPGMGEKFFSGPYLDKLPNWIIRWTREQRAQ